MLFSYEFTINFGGTHFCVFLNICLVIRKLWKTSPVTFNRSVLFLTFTSLCSGSSCFLSSKLAAAKIFKYRSSHWRCSVKTVFLKISQNSQENTCVGVSFLKKLQVFEVVNFFRTPPAATFAAAKITKYSCSASGLFFFMKNTTLR